MRNSSSQRPHGQISQKKNLENVLIRIIQGIGGLDQSMKKKNNEVVIENDDDLENIPITSEETVKSKFNWKFWKRDKDENGERRHLIKANDLNEKSKKSMITRIISAVVGLFVLVPAIFLGGWVYFALVTLALGFACYEILGCTNKRTIVTVLVYFLFCALIIYWPLFKYLVVNGTADPKIESYYNMIYLPIIVIIAGSFLVFFLTVVYKDFTIQDACFLIAMAIIVGLGFQCLLYLRYYPLKLLDINTNVETWKFTLDNTIRPSLLLIFVIFSTFMTDIGAYFVGIFFGKNKINERISPNKTWEGFVGGIVISFLFSSSLGLILSAIGWPIYDASNVSFLLNREWYLILVLSALIPLFATLGDFVFSSIKRYWGIKDYGKLIPGHGGVLDRLDSIIFAVIIASIFVFMLSVISDDKFGWAEFLV